MKKFQLENFGHANPLSLNSGFFLVETLKLRLQDEAIPTQLKTKDQVAEAQALEYQSKLQSLNIRLQNGYSLIKNKIR